MYYKLLEGNSGINVYIFLLSKNLQIFRFGPCELYYIFVESFTCDNPTYMITFRKMSHR